MDSAFLSSVFAGPIFRCFSLLAYSLLVFCGSGQRPLFPLLSLVHVIFSFIFPATLWLCISKQDREYLNINAGNTYHDFLGSFSRERDQGFLSGLFKQSSRTVRASPSIILLGLFSLKLLVMPLLESAALLCAFTASQVRELIWLENDLFFSGS